jgi:hypothetical protein
LQWCLLVVFACSKSRNQAETTKPFHQVRETAAIFVVHGREFQAQSTAGRYMPHHSFGPDLSFFDKKMKVRLLAHGLGLPCLDKQTAGA